MARGTWRYTARVIVHASAEHVRPRIPTPIEIEEPPDGRCAFAPGSDHPERLALYLGMLGADFEVVQAPELVAAVEQVIARYQRAIGARRRVGLFAACVTSWRANRCDRLTA